MSRTMYCRYFPTFLITIFDHCQSWFINWLQLPVIITKPCETRVFTTFSNTTSWPLTYVLEDSHVVTHLCTECVLKKIKSKRPKNTNFDRERLQYKVCTCSTFANECQCNTMSIDIQVLVLGLTCLFAAYFLSISAIVTTSLWSCSVHLGMWMG